MATQRQARAWFGKDRAPGKLPLKVNAFEQMAAHQGMLEQIPLFPYFGPGDIVPTAALSLSLPDMPRIHFYHYNDVTEVILTLAGDGALLAAGQLYLQKGTHGVTTFLRKAQGPEAAGYQISYIVVRMKREGPQNEGWILRCTKCNEVVFQLYRDVWAPPDARPVPELPNVRFYADAADAYNEGPRVCEKCGEAQPRFPAEIVGWRRYAEYVDLAHRARADIEAAARVTKAS
jgi:hypothetical protein